MEVLSPSELKELNSIRAELREPRYLIQNIEKNNVSVFESYKKTDKANLKQLIDINKNLEDIASEKIKLEDDRKKAEKELEAKAEELRIEKIKSDIENVENYCLEILQKITFENLSIYTNSIKESLYAEYDFEEYDLLFDQVKDKVEKLLEIKTNDVTERENQRLENEAMKQEIFEVRVNRLKEIGFEFKDDIFSSESIDIIFTKEQVYNTTSQGFESELSDIKKALEQIQRDKRNAELKAIQDKADAELKKQKDEQFEIRKNRLAEIDFLYHYVSFINDEFDVEINNDVYNASITEFEEILLDAKNYIVDIKEQKEISEQQAKELE